VALAPPRARALKFLWALLDIATIAVLITGLYLWGKQKKGAPRCALLS